MIQEHGAIVIDPRGQVSEVCRREFRPGQCLEIRDIEDLVGSDRRLVKGRLGNCLTQAKPRHSEQCRSSRQAMEKPAARSRVGVFIMHRAAYGCFGDFRPRAHDAAISVFVEKIGYSWRSMFTPSTLQSPYVEKNDIFRHMGFDAAFPIQRLTRNSSR